jgi:hypothetical protein
MTEEYKLCFDNYKISNLGNIKNGDKLLKGSIQNRGYRYIQLNRGGQRNNILIHHLVAKYFISDRPDNMVIDHIDRNKLNNNVSNLRYISQKENMINQDRYRDDITETDTKERKKIFQREYDLRTGHNKNIYRKKGTGGITKRNENSYRASIIINDIKTRKTFKTYNDAEIWLSSVNIII